jgi:membrane-bound serine protease (ClpP class)
VIQLSANAAFTVFILGLLFIYFELCAPGLVLPGSTGAVLLLAGAASLMQKGSTAIGAAFLAAGLALLCMAIYGKRFRLRLTSSIVFLTVGVKLLIPERDGISLFIALPLTVLAAGATVLLSRLALLARKTKRTPDFFEN